MDSVSSPFGPLSSGSGARSRQIMGLLIMLFMAGTLMSLSSSCLAMEPLNVLEVRPEVWVASDRVTILNLLSADKLPEDWKRLMGGIDLGEAPANGQEKFIGSAPLKSYLEKLVTTHGQDPSQVRFQLPPDQVVIRRKANSIADQEIEAIFRNHILSNVPWRSEDVEISGITQSGTAELPPGTVTHVVEAGPRERYVGNVVLTIHFFVDGVKKRSVKVSGKVQVYQEVVVAARPLTRNDTLTDLDVRLQRVLVGENIDRYALSIEQVVGRRLLRDTGLHQPLVVGDLDAPVLIKKGTAVTILYEQPGLKISAAGQAREDGRAGKALRVLNTQTNRTVISEIVDGSTVRARP